MLENRSFPADLLLSYTSIKNFLFPEGALLSLAISDSSRLSNMINLIIDESMNEREAECMNDIECDSDRVFCLSEEKSTEITQQVSVMSDEQVDVCMKETFVLQYISGEQFHRLRQQDEANDGFDMNDEATDFF